MSWRESVSISNPEVPRLVDGLEGLLAGKKEVVLPRIRTALKPDDPEVLARVLTQLVRAGRIEQVFRVESPSGAGMGDYGTLAEVPEVLFDDHTGQEVTVALDNLRILFRAASR